MIKYDSLSALLHMAQEANLSLSALVLADQAAQMELTLDAVYQRMCETLAVMQSAAAQGAKADVRSTSGLTGGDGFRMQQYAQAGGALSGSFAAAAIAKAIATAEYNAAMGKIVAAPTAGSCGIVPAAVLTMLESGQVAHEQAVMSLFCAGAIGMVIANLASISGAEGGCQAECGSAAAMAAGALVELKGGTPDMIGHAAAIALKNQLGLVCDPVAGLVEVPCIKRNAVGIMCAITAADMALAGIRSVIPVDEVIEAMRAVGDALPCSLRETAGGGLAATSTGDALREKIFG